MSVRLPVKNEQQLASSALFLKKKQSRIQHAGKLTK
jgi:hypothetical protein